MSRISFTKKEEKVYFQSATLFKELVVDLTIYLKKLESELSQVKWDFDQQYVLYELLERATLNIAAIDRLTNNFIEDVRFKIPICIILRTLISDAIIATYLTDPIEEGSYTRAVPAGRVIFSEEQRMRFNTRYELLTGEALSKVKKRIDELIRYEVMSSELGNEIWEGWKTNFASCFESNGKIKKMRNGGVKPLVKEIDGPDSKDFAKKLYSPYSILSQYEHFSKLTVQMMQMDSQGTIDEAADQMLVSLYLIIRGIQGSLLYLNEETKRLDELIRKIMPMIEMHND